MQNNLLVAGGGFTGTVAVMNVLRAALLAESGTADSSSVLWIDKEGHFGRGLPYREQLAGIEDPFLLNIPAHMMSPFSDQRDLYTHWLRRNAPQYNEFSFTPRSVYGRFIESVLADLQAQIRLRRPKVKVVVRKAELIDVQRQCDGLSAKLSDSQVPFACEAISLCLGHERLDGFAKLAAYPGYVGNPYLLEDYQSALGASDENNVAIVIGGGSSSIDAVRALEALRFSGQYLIISSSPAEPWGWDAELYKRRQPDLYQPSYLTPEAAHACGSLQELLDLLEAEISHALAHGFGYGSVYFGISPQKLFGNTDCFLHYRSDFLHHLFQCRKAMSAPESIRLLEQLGGSGRLVRLHATAIADGSTNRGKRFQIKLKDTYPAVIEGDILVNCTQVVRAYQEPLKNGLIARLCASQLIRLSSAGLLEYVEGSGVYPLGPMSAPKEGGPRYLWSARFFREEIRSGVSNMLSNIAAYQHAAAQAGVPASTSEVIGVFS